MARADAGERQLRVEYAAKRTSPAQTARAAAAGGNNGPRACGRSPIGNSDLLKKTQRSEPLTSTHSEVASAYYSSQFPIRTSEKTG